MNVTDNSGAISATTDQTAGDAGNGSQRPVNSISENAGTVKAVGERLQNVNGLTKIAIPENKEK